MDTYIELLRNLLASEYGPYITALLVVVAVAQRFLGPKQDWVETRRRKYLLKLHELLSLIGGYAKIQKNLHEYAYTVTVPQSEIQPDDTDAADALERVLYRGTNGVSYHRNLIAAVKSLLLPDGTHIAAVGSWVYRQSLLSDEQHHATIFPHPLRPRTFIFIQHKELSWVRHPIKHIRGIGQKGGDPDNVLARVLKASPLSFEVEDREDIRGESPTQSPK